MIIKKPYRYYLVLLLFFLIAGLALLVADIIRRPHPGQTSVSMDAIPKAGTADIPADTRLSDMFLYFVPAEASTDGRGILIEENRLVRCSGSVTDKAHQLLNELAEGSSNGHLAPLAAEARLLQLFLLPDGTAIVNYSGALVENHPRGVEGELASVYAVVNTLMRNFPEITSVRLLVDGAERDTLAGHVDLSGNLKQDLSFVRGYEQTPSPVRVEPLPP